MRIADDDAWWGGLAAVGNHLFLTNYVWFDRGDHPHVRYYLNDIDISNPASPRVASSVNIPGVFVGASDDLRSIYTIDYRWTTDSVSNSFNVLSYDGQHAALVSTTAVDGWLGNVYVRSGHAYFTSQSYTGYYYDNASLRLHALDLTVPAHPVDRAGVATTGWGWLLGVEGDRAVVTSNDGAGVNVFRLVDGEAPQWESFQRTRGWWGYNLSRQNNTIFLATGYWGVQTISLPQ
jgi:hypothetical protein